MPSDAFHAVLQVIRENDTLGQPLEERRESIEKAAESMPPPEDVRITPVDAGGVPGEWIDAPEARADRVVLYLHGGAYVICSPRTHRRLTAGLSRETKGRVLAVDYRLAPEHPFPAAVEDAVTAYRWLLEDHDPKHIAITGDSAGGGLTVATLVCARDEGLPMPACAVAISPWTDLEMTGETVATKQQDDPIIDAIRLKEEADLYLNGIDARHPLASPIYADLRRLPPLLIHVGGREVLLDDSVRLADRARRAGVDVTLDVDDEMVHVWHVFTQIVPESDEAVRHVGRFLSRHLG